MGILIFHEHPQCSTAVIRSKIAAKSGVDGEEAGGQAIRLLPPLATGGETDGQQQGATWPPSSSSSAPDFAAGTRSTALPRYDRLRPGPRPGPHPCSGLYSLSALLGQPLLRSSRATVPQRPEQTSNSN